MEFKEILRKGTRLTSSDGQRVDGVAREPEDLAVSGNDPDARTPAFSTAGQSQ